MGDSSRPWILAMRWQDLLFAHWQVDPALLLPHLPQGLELDLYRGAAWLGVVPFRMSGVRPRWTPPLPEISAFPELNLRTYVKTGDRPGVWFFSLDAASWLAVRMARATFHLPYFDAEMRCAVESDGSVDYSSRRVHRGVVPATLRCRYRPVGQVFRAEPATLEHWLTERYCLYTADGRGRVLRGDVRHEPWRLQRAEVEFEECRMTGLLGAEFGAKPDHLLFARSLDVVASWPRVVHRASHV